MGKYTHFYNLWRDDCDYQGSLPDPERAWLEKFRAEYYRAEFDENPLHDENGRRDVYQAHNAAARDLVTKPGDDVLESLEKIANVERPCLSIRFYDLGDYRMFSNPANQDDELVVEWLDAAGGLRRRTLRGAEAAQILEIIQEKDSPAPGELILLRTA